MFGALSFSGHADENLVGYAYGSETLPKRRWEIYQWITHRAGKTDGTYRATDYSTEFEYASPTASRFRFISPPSPRSRASTAKPGRHSPSNYYAGNEHLRSLSILVHDAVGLAFPLILGWHIVRGRRAGLTPSRPGR